MEAIIEDDVTSRFEAEELKNWNLLTRTNRRYEFISWRLTVIWVIGFLIRYLLLMPLRVIICFIGVSKSRMCFSGTLIFSLGSQNNKRNWHNRSCGWFSLSRSSDAFHTNVFVAGWTTAHRWSPSELSPARFPPLSISITRNTSRRTAGSASPITHRPLMWRFWRQIALIRWWDNDTYLMPAR